MKKFLTAVTAIVASFTLVACSNNSKAPEASSMMTEANAQPTVIRIGVSPTPHAVIIEALKDDFKAAGLDVQPVIFDDYVQPNLALSEGDLEANYFQHLPYFESFSKEHNLKLANLGYVHLEPMGLYSTKYKNLKEFQKGDEILIPNDVSNGARALRLLEKNGLIKLGRDGLDVTVLDIVENPLELKITALNAPTIPSAYGDVAAGVINSNFLISFKIHPSSAIAREEAVDNPYANLVAVRAGDETKPEFQKLIEILRSEKAKAFIEAEFKGEILTAK